MIVAWGEQVGLRPFRDPLSEAEVASVYAWSRDPDVTRLSGSVPTDLSLGEFATRLRKDHLADDPDRQVYFILTRANELIGRVGCFAIDWQAREAELGIVIGDRNYWDRGYGRDAVLTFLHFLFETTLLERIYLFTFKENLRAQKAFAACGFRSLGMAHRFSPDVGEYEGIEMEMTRLEFYAKQYSNPNSIFMRNSYAQVQAPR